MSRKLTLSLSLVAVFALGWFLPRLLSDDAKKNEFASATIDIGTVVADLDKSVRFYTEAIGFKEITGFEVPGEFAKDVGLTSGKNLKVRVLVLGDGPTAAKLKLMEMSSEKPKKNENEYIHSQLGFRYLTIFVSDTNAAMERLKKAGVKTLGKTPAALPDKAFLTIVRDPDGNLVELIGPKK
jgi:lactoylglutathione lyase